eukprot:CAMPEP_0177205590 /NCGR_PEP_ID=MMETSP0367-20130122/28946_1 /TAXON_ID=447022 ORGANISM="Scrippsiella hangoei-like, Strain SHHI-4" /NCGR_SAMPLE_ID=MMETSP0367 /ASSEMBLY_ACC=CAM_ASM_000362 /LENGTH=63 /DNA_ID=CAMNT_0018654331 /DNA_START=495 /DNA_END=682 /DNA_ORIENTATION=-
MSWHLLFCCFTSSASDRLSCSMVRTPLVRRFPGELALLRGDWQQFACPMGSTCSRACLRGVAL